MVMKKFLVDLKFHFVLAFVIRFLFTIYGLKRDEYCETTVESCVKYTDIDYRVFTDAAKYVYEGKSPYDRDTYRYTPLLAIILQPNIWLSKSFGKFLFIAFDLLCGLIILKTLKKHDSTAILKALCFWFYNPITIAISSRGNAESIMSFIVLAFLWSFQQENYILSGFLYGLAIHFKIYPIIYALVIFFNLIEPVLSGPGDWLKRLSKACINLYEFGLSVLLTFGLLTYSFYHKYGYTFLYETYIYHSVRKDIRHNFSPFFYLYNVYATGDEWSVFLKLASVLPQVIVIIACSCLLYKRKDLIFSIFLTTYLFVTFNKVCTAQYFVWYLSLIPLIMPNLKVSVHKTVVFFSLWIAGQALWLFFAYQLEFNGKNMFFELWLASLVFLSINCCIIKNFFITSYENSETIKKKD